MKTLQERLRLQAQAIHELKTSPRFDNLRKQGVWESIMHEARSIYREALPEDRLANRQKLAETLEMYDTGEPFIWTVVGGMDCDCCTFEYMRQAPPGAFMHERWLADFYNNAEGPQYHYYKPTEEAEKYEQPRSRDLILEAYEDGHPHVVHY